MSATLFIGLGTSGLRVLEHVQRMYYGNSGTNQPLSADGQPLTQMIYVETHTGVSREGLTPGVDAIQAQFIPLRGAKTSISMLNASDLRPDTAWLPDPQLMEHMEEGAGGMRCFGRLALWSTPNDGGGIHFAQLADRINSAWQAMGAPPDVQIVIVSSLCGGTGSGIFIDVAYLARFCVSPQDPGAANVTGLLLLPPSFLNAQQGPRIQANGWGCLHDLDFYSREHSVFPARWPINARPQAGFNAGLSPFKLVTFMSQAREAGGDVTFEHQIKLAGLFLFACSMGFEANHRGARVVDAQSNEGDGSFSKYSFVNLAALVYPKLEIEEVAALRLATAFLRRLCESADCPGPNILGNIEVEANKRPVARLLDPLLLGAFALMSKAGEHDSMEILLADFARKASREEIADPVRELRLALQETDGRYYNLVKPRAAETRRLLADGLTGILRQAMEDSSSLPYTRLIYSRCSDHLRKTLQWLKGFQVDGDRWAARIEALSRWVFSTSLVYIPKARRSLLEQRLGSALELLKMHFLVPILSELCDHIDGRPSAAFLALGLPGVTDLDAIAAALLRSATAASTPEERSRAQSAGTLKDRMDVLCRDGDSQRQQIHVYYPSGTFEAEVEKAMSRLGENLGQRTQGAGPAFIRQLLSRGDTQHLPLLDQLWKFWQGGNLSQTAHDCADNYMKLLRQHDIVPDLRIEEVIDNNAAALTALARKAALAPLLTHHPKQNSTDYPKAIISQTGSIAQLTIGALQARGCQLFTQGAHRIAVCDRIRNMVLFVDERSDRLDPLSDIINADLWKSHYFRVGHAKKDAYGVLRAQEAAAAAAAGPAAAHPVKTL